MTRRKATSKASLHDQCAFVLLLLNNGPSYCQPRANTGSPVSLKTRIASMAHISSRLEEYIPIPSEEPLETGVYPLPRLPSDSVRFPPEDTLQLDATSRDSGLSELVEHPTHLLGPRIPPSVDPSKLTFVNGLALVLGLQIGSGIFSAPSQVSLHVPSPLVGVLVWLLGGSLVYTGAATFIELGLAIPRNGGIQEYLQACYGDLMGFLFTWVWVFISKPSAMAMIAMIFSDHLCRAMDLPSTPEFLKKALALIGIGLITFVNCLGVKSGATLANGFLILKLFAIASISIIGLGLITTNAGHQLPAGRPGWFVEQVDYSARTPWAKAGDFVTAIFGALFCYGGWETVSLCFLVLLESKPLQLSMETKAYDTDRFCGWRYEQPKA